MTPISPEDRKTLRRRARALYAIALIALAGGVVLIMGGNWPPGLILVFAAVASVMTARQLRGYDSAAPQRCGKQSCGERNNVDGEDGQDWGSGRIARK